jgi:hypothetical protein
MTPAHGGFCRLSKENRVDGGQLAARSARLRALALQDTGQGMQVNLVVDVRCQKQSYIPCMHKQNSLLKPRG